VEKIQGLLAVLTAVLTLILGVLARSVLTPRAWWFLLSTLLCLVAGLFTGSPLLTLLGLSLLLWFSSEWVLFSLRLRLVLPRLQVEREVSDQRGPVNTLWSGQSFQVRVVLVLPPTQSGLLELLWSLPHVAVHDRVPFTVERTDPGTPDELLTGPGADGAVRGDQALALEYTIRCPGIGQVRFEGVGVQLADLQGFFYHSTFLRQPVVLRVMPRLVEYDAQGATHKRSNQLPPPGHHRLHRPGSGSELLDLRDYLPGDPPRTIAWKVSARKDRLITKEFESEVPIRCTLFVDISTSVRVPGRQGTALQRLVEVAAAVLRCNADRRDLTGLCLFDEHGSSYARPERASTHVTRMLRILTDASVLAPATRKVDPDRLLPLAYALAEEVYPDQLRPERNRMPFWVTWVAGFPGHWRRRVSLMQYLHRRKLTLLWTATTILPLSLLVFNYLVSGFLRRGERALLLATTALVSVLSLLAVLLLFLVAVVFGGRQRRLSAWRKRLAALLAVRHGLDPGGLEAMLEDDDVFVLHLQRFLAEHQVPYSLPLYDGRGRYLFAAPEKLPVLGKALLQAVSRGQDNELFVLLADLLELDEHLEPLLQAVRVALGRHHQVILVCPWPAGLALPDNSPDSEALLAQPLAGALPRRSDERAFQRLLSRVTARVYHAAYQRVRRRFAALGVTVVCAAGDEAVPLILQRIDRLRLVRGRA
jgi:uncharacterized protein (DUF58 family)